MRVQAKGDTAAAEAQMRAIAEADPSNSAAALDVARFLIRGEGVEAGRAELERLIATAEDKFTFQMALAQLAVSDPKAFADLAEMAKKAVPPQGVAA